MRVAAIFKLQIEKPKVCPVLERRSANLNRDPKFKEMHEEIQAYSVEAKYTSKAR